MNDTNPRPVRNGQRYRFNLVDGGRNAQCVDEDNLLYEYGEFRYVNNFENCASVCVQLVQPNLLNGGSFQGTD